MKEYKRCKILMSMILQSHDIILHGKRIDLRPTTEDDWESLLVWYNDPEVLYYSESEDVSSHTIQQVQYIYAMVSQHAY